MYANFTTGGGRETVVQNESPPQQQQQDPNNSGLSSTNGEALEGTGDVEQQHNHAASTFVDALRRIFRRYSRSPWMDRRTACKLLKKKTP